MKVEFGVGHAKKTPLKGQRFEKRLTSKGQEETVRATIRQVIYNAARRRIQIEFQPGVFSGKISEGGPS